MRRPIGLVLSVALLVPAISRAQTGSGEGAPLTLREVEALALQHNPTIGAAASSIGTAEGRVRQAGAWPNPVIGYAGEELGSSANRGAHGFFVQQTIPLGGKLARARAASAETVEEAGALQALQRLRVLASVRQAYYRVLIGERRVRVQQRLTALASEAVSVTAQLFNVGAADRPDYLEMEIEIRRAQLDLNRASNEVFAARQVLAALAGTPEVARRPLAEDADAALPELERDRVIRELLERSPELQAARAALSRAQAFTAVTRAATAPDLVVRAGGAYNREPAEARNGRIGWEGSVEAGISVPLFNRNAGGIAAARAEEARAGAEVRRVELSLQARAADVFAQYLSALRSVESYRGEIVPRAEEAYRLYLSRYREMAAAYPQVLVAQRALFELSHEYLESLETAWTAVHDLQGLLAGPGLQTPRAGGAATEAGDGMGGHE